MLKLEQIKLVDTELIVKGFEPEVYTRVGEIEHSDDIKARDKDNSPFILAEIVAIGQPIPPTSIATDITLLPQSYYVGQTILIGKNVATHLTMPIEGYKEKELAIISAYAVTAIIELDNSVPTIEFAH
jgi:hypothetical protein